MMIERTGPKKEVLKTRDLLARPEESRFDFDPDAVVPEEIWQELASFLGQNRSTRPSFEYPLLRLSVFRPEIRERVEQDQDLLNEVEIEIYNKIKEYNNVDFHVNIDVNRYSSLFSEIIEHLDDEQFPFPHDFNKAMQAFDARVDYVGPLNRRIRVLIPGLKALLQLFPEKRDVLLTKAEELNFFSVALKEVQEMSHPPFERIIHLPAFVADLIQIFPDHKAALISIVEPLWKELVHEMKSWGDDIYDLAGKPEPMEQPGEGEVTGYVEGVLGMKYLADVSGREKLSTTRPLPDRSV